jgi:hypothetical protein
MDVELHLALARTCLERTRSYVRVGAGRLPFRNLIGVSDPWLLPNIILLNFS